MSRDTKYGHLIDNSDDQNDADDVDEEPEPPAQLQYQTVKVLWRTEPRDLEFRALISHGDHSWEPICTHVDRAHRIEGSNQFDPMGSRSWTEIPRRVQERIVDVVAGVDAVEELDPEHEIGFSRDGGDGA
ncbi:hypothetical protein [Halorussus marinus]|uniref:hypothetical protein n=1 Tax=Halorussus marinus TaxID=2505976 RepID=UPI00106E3CC6|nr:hypothetical protein [Halorussus marinus]